MLALTEKIQPRNHFGSPVPALRAAAQLLLGNGAEAALEYQFMIDHRGIFQNEQALARAAIAPSQGRVRDTDVVNRVQVGA